MNKRKTILAFLAVFLVSILVVGSTGCGAQKTSPEWNQLQKDVAQLQKDMGQLLKEKQAAETQKTQATEDERIAQIVAKVVDSKLSSFEAKLAEKEKADRLTELEKRMTELESRRTYPSPYPCPPTPTPYPYPYPYPYYDAASFRAEVYQGDFSEYVGTLDNPYPINFDWGYGGPLGLTNYFSIRWEGSVYSEDANYRFRVRADDGFRLYVDGYLLLDRWSPHTTRTHEVTRYLSAGYHTVRLEYRELTGLAQVSLYWDKIQ